MFLTVSFFNYYNYQLCKLQRNLTTYLYETHLKNLQLCILT